MNTVIPSLFFCEREISEEEWAQTPDSVRRAFDWLWQERERLREQAGQSSRNSSLPPSQDRPAQRKPRRKAITTRAPGGQPGHPGVTRPLAPPEELTRPPISVLPADCPRCGHVFPADTPVTGAPYRHQVLELPQITPDISEYHLQHRACPRCGATVRAPRPAGVPALTLGPRAQALITLLSGQYHLAKRQVADLLRQLVGIPLCAASICAVEQSMSAALAAPVEATLDAVRQAPVKYMDESGFPQRRDPDPEQPPQAPLTRGWLWSITIPRASYYRIRRSRGQAVARKLLGGALTGVVVTDRYAAYNWLPLAFRQLCWAHLDRDFLAISERADPVAQRIGQGLMKQADAVFHAWRRYREGALTFTELGAALQPVRTEVAALLRAGHEADPKTKTTCHLLLQLEPALWTFLRVEGVEPTNNAAERAQRRGVMKRDRTFGTQSSAGSRYVERVLTTVATCQLQRRNVLAYLTEALRAHLHGAPAPSLIPP